MLTLDLDATQLILGRSYQLHFLRFFQNISSYKYHITRPNTGEIHNQLIERIASDWKGSVFSLMELISIQWVHIQTEGNRKDNEIKFDRLLLQNKTYKIDILDTYIFITLSRLTCINTLHFKWFLCIVFSFRNDENNNKRG